MFDAERPLRLEVHVRERVHVGQQQLVRVEPTRVAAGSPGPHADLGDGVPVARLVPADHWPGSAVPSARKLCRIVVVTSDSPTTKRASWLPAMPRKLRTGPTTKTQWPTRGNR